jgi:hypothetical protein
MDSEINNDWPHLLRVGRVPIQTLKRRGLDLQLRLDGPNPRFKQ